MGKITRQDIYFINRHIPLDEKEIDTALAEKVYSSAAAWKQFTKLFFLCLGIGFLISGITFLFAYNWDDLPKSFKFVLVEGLTIGTVIAVLVSKSSTLFKKILLTAASALAGVAFAVFGQIYQTGADAYDLFLVWTVSIFLWVIVSDFPSLWLMFIILIDITCILYHQQVTKHWPPVSLFLTLFIIQSAVVISALMMPRYRIPKWFTYTIALGAAGFATIGLIVGIFDNYVLAFPVFIVITSIVYVLGIRYGMEKKNMFFLSVIPLSVIIILSALLINISDSETMWISVFIFIILSVTLLIKILLNFKATWQNEP